MVGHRKAWLRPTTWVLGLRGPTPGSVDSLAKLSQVGLLLEQKWKHVNGPTSPEKPVFLRNASGIHRPLRLLLGWRLKP